MEPGPSYREQALFDIIAVSYVPDLHIPSLLAAYAKICSLTMSSRPARPEPHTVQRFPFNAKRICFSKESIQKKQMTSSREPLTSRFNEMSNSSTRSHSQGLGSECQTVMVMVMVSLMVVAKKKKLVFFFSWHKVCPLLYLNYPRQRLMDSDC